MTTTPLQAAHTAVACWKLNEDNTEAHAAELSGAIEAQIDIPGVVAVEHGPRIAAVDWEGPDKDFDYAMIVRFADLQSVRAYPSHPLHQQLIGTIFYVGDGEVRWYWLDC
ncbi:Dabb family protein [Novosphingobium sp. PP1Y]|uniref:Dabb family protein n=1 Tax=Novosphingobium sp. PP1Y TaxID=702113 RepID=UPI00020EF368|nr:Dabb family protein [Novosphingobium sp. PP1Y]CCA94011.1 stress responsive alpha-beta barrel domain-containing protein [Novosphingobium sp. PP1Y]